jgi:Protein of unknown function (DUF4199)
MINMEETTTPQVSLFQHAAKWGAIFGGVSIALTAIAYAVDYTMLADWKFGIFVLVLLLAATIYAGINYRNEIGGFLPYGKAFQHGFILLAISGIISTVFSLLLYTVIDSDLPSKLTDVTIENTQKMLEGFGVPEDKMDEAMEDAKARAKGQFSAFGLVKAYGFGLIFYAIISLITSIFVRKNQPEELM